MGISSGSTRLIALTVLSFAAWGCASDPNAPAPHTPSISSAIAVSSLDVSDGHGKAWRQLNPTTGLSWTQVAQVCPRNGATPCNGAAAGRDLTGWVWATAAQVRALLARYEDDLLTSPSVSGPQYFFTADVFFQSFIPTFSFSGYNGSSTYGAGWTSSTDPSGIPIFGSVGNGHNMVSIAGHFSSAGVAAPDTITADRGVFLWRADGSGVAPQSFVLSKASFTVKEGKVGQFTVCLAQQPAAKVVVSVAFVQGTAVVVPTPAKITFTRANWSKAVTVKFGAPQDADQSNNAAVIALSSPGIATAQVAVTIKDDD